MAFGWGGDLHLFWMLNFLAQSGVVRPDNFYEEAAELVKALPASRDFQPLTDRSMETLLGKVRQSVAGKQVRFGSRMVDPIYTPTNDYLVNTFQITPEEEKQCLTIHSRVERARRYELKKERQKEKRAEVRAAKAQSLHISASDILVGAVPEDEAAKRRFYRERKKRGLEVPRFIPQIPANLTKNSKSSLAPKDSLCIITANKNAVSTQDLLAMRAERRSRESREAERRAKERLRRVEVMLEKEYGMSDLMSAAMNDETARKIADLTEKVIKLESTGNMSYSGHDYAVIYEDLCKNKGQAEADSILQTTLERVNALLATERPSPAVSPAKVSPAEAEPSAAPSPSKPRSSTLNGLLARSTPKSAAPPAKPAASAAKGAPPAPSVPDASGAKPKVSGLASLLERSEGLPDAPEGAFNTGGEAIYEDLSGEPEDKKGGRTARGSARPQAAVGGSSFEASALNKRKKSLPPELRGKSGAVPDAGTAPKWTAPKEVDKLPPGSKYTEEEWNLARAKNGGCYVFEYWSLAPDGTVFSTLMQRPIPENAINTDGPLHLFNDGIVLPEGVKEVPAQAGHKYCTIEMHNRFYRIYHPKGHLSYEAFGGGGFGKMSFTDKEPEVKVSKEQEKPKEAQGEAEVATMEIG